jgi:Fe2+ or Zn2+ uptake regulation protein
MKEKKLTPNQNRIIKLLGLAECAVTAKDIVRGLKEIDNFDLSLEAVRRNCRQLVINNKIERISSRTGGRFDLNWRAKVYTAKIPEGREEDGNTRK